MNNKKILLSFLLVVLIALSVASVSAAEDASDLVADSDDDDVVGSTDDVDIVSTTYQPTSNNATAVQDAINKATQSGDIVDLSNHAEYDFGNGSVKITQSNIVLKGNGSTIIKGYGANNQGRGDALIVISEANNVTIQGITFIDTHPLNNFTYGGTVYGAAVNYNRALGGLLSNCTFQNFSNAAIVQGSNDVVLENNYINGGYSTLIANDPTVNTETGSKSFNIYGQSSKITVRGNTFEGYLLDGVSIAQGSGANIVENNKFINNAYGIYFGGSSTKNSVIRNNTFINCGQFKRDGKNWTELPVISIQKASNDISIVDNKFEALNDSVLIAAEQGNEAHGFPSSLGNINVTGNNVSASDANNVVLFHILVRNDLNLHIFAPIAVENNILANGVDGLVVEIKELGIEVIRVNETTLTDINTFFPANNTLAAVQAAVDLAVNPGDVVDLSNFKSYDFGNGTLFIKNSNVVLKGATTVNKGVTSITTIKGHGANDAGKGNAIIEITGSNVTVHDLYFIDTHPSNNFTYGGTVYGAAVRFKGVTGGLLTDCVFEDFNSAAIVQGSTLVVLENNNIKGGYTTVIANDPTINVETGSKSFNIYGQSAQITVRGNTFEGYLLDGVSIAQGSGANIVENNIFIDNAYGIYFGGSSTKNSVIRNNTFINCGQFKRDNQNWTRLPVISIQKASNDIAIVNNTFKVIDDNVLIAAEQGNEAHGFPSSLGNINVTGNTVELYNASVDPTSVTLFHILVRNGELLVFAPINVTNNKVAKGVKEVDIWNSAWGDEYTQSEGIVIPVIQGKPTPTMTVTDVNITAGESAIIQITLADGKTKLATKDITVSYNGVLYNLTTDKNGAASLNITGDVAGTYYATVTFVGDNDYKAVIANAKVTVNAKPTPVPPTPATKKATTLTAKKATLKVKKAKKIKVTLKSEGKAVAGKQITIKVNKKTFKAKTNAKGVAKVKVKVTKKGKYNAVVKFAGDSDYNAATAKVKLTVKK